MNLYVECPELWTPDSPILHQLEIKLVDGNGILIDGMLQKVGIRKIEYRGRDGLYLNNKPYRDKLIGVNRHQDFAIIGNALPNSLHWRDAKNCVMREFVLYAVFITLMILLFWMPVTNSVF